MMNSSREKERLARQRKQKRRRRRQIMIIVMEVVLLVILGGCCYVISVFNQMQETDFDEDKIYRPSFEENNNLGESNEGKGEADESREENNQIFDYDSVLDQYWNILLVGLDSRVSDEQCRSDVMIICSIDKATNNIKLASVYRDTYMKMAYSGGGYNKANEAYFYSNGDIYSTINTLNMNLDIYITDYVIVDWAVVAKCVNLLGGVTVELTAEHIDPQKGIFNSLVTEIVESTGIASHQIWNPGTYTLDGVQTVAYCRMRKSDSDYQRTERQRQVIEQLFKKAQKANVGVLISIMNQLTEHVRFSIDEGDLLNMVLNATQFEIVDQCGYPFNKQSDKKIGKIDITYPVVPINVVENVNKLHEFLFGEQGYEPSKQLKEISSHIEKMSGLG